MRTEGCRGLSRRQLVKGLMATPLILSMPARAQLSATQYQFGVASIDPIYSAIYVAFKKGFFKDAGLTAINLPEASIEQITSTAFSITARSFRAASASATAMS